MKLSTLLPITYLTLTSAVAAQDVFPNIEYISGKDGFSEKIKGQLVVSETEVRFEKDGALVFAIPMANVKEASNNSEENPGSTGRKLLLGLFANKKEEFVYVTTESTESAEAVVFKTKNKMSPGIVAKIRFQIKKNAPPVPEAAPVDTAPHS